MHQTTAEIDYPYPAPHTPYPEPTTCRIPRPGVATPQIWIRPFATVCDRVNFAPNTTSPRRTCTNGKRPAVGIERAGTIRKLFDGLRVIETQGGQMRFQKQKPCLTCPLPAKPSGSQLLAAQPAIC